MKSPINHRRKAPIAFFHTDLDQSLSISPGEMQDSCSIDSMNVLREQEIERRAEYLRQRHSMAERNIFKVPDRYSDLVPIGKGSYGLVCMAYDNLRGYSVAIKKISPMSRDCIDAKHVLREMRLLRHLGAHENIVTLVDLICRPEEDSLYIVMELLNSDLHKVNKSAQVLNENHHRVIMLQLLRGLAYMHESGVIHRDLKPANILVSRECDVCITDFGFARCHGSSTSSAHDDVDDLTEHVVTRWYRPPELMLSPNKDYNSSVDMWSVGCIFAELLGRKPLFPGSNFMHQLALIFEILGGPLDEEIAHIRGSHARKFLRSVQDKVRKPCAEIFPSASKDAINLLERLLVFDPSKRLTAREALQHPYFSEYSEEIFVAPPPPEALNFEFEHPGLSRSSLRQLIFNEVADFQCEMACTTDEFSSQHSSVSSIMVSDWSPVTNDARNLNVKQANKKILKHQRVPSNCDVNRYSSKNSDVTGTDPSQNNSSPFTSKTRNLNNAGCTPGFPIRNRGARVEDDISYFAKSSVGTTADPSRIHSPEDSECDSNDDNLSNGEFSLRTFPSNHIRWRSAATCIKNLKCDDSIPSAPLSPNSRLEHALTALLVKPTPRESFRQLGHSRSRSTIYSSNRKRDSPNAAFVSQFTPSKPGIQFFRGLRRPTGSTASVSNSSFGRARFIEDSGTCSPYQMNNGEVKSASRRHRRKPSLLRSLKLPLSRLFHKRWGASVVK